jgi:hypothetical protein
MRKYFRTLLLLGLTGGVGAASGCIVETSDGPGPSSAACAANRTIAVEWWMDDGIGTPRLACAASPPAEEVELRMASGAQYLVPGTCDDTQSYNWYGRTAAGVDPQDYVTHFRLIAADTGAELSPGDSFASPSPINPTVPACQPLFLTYQFPEN